MSQDEKVDILIVDDQEENLIALESILEDLGENVIRARSGFSALKYLLDHDCAVILLDVMMPDLDGFQTAYYIRERERSRRIPIIFLTAADRNEQQKLEGYAAGAVDYIVKPFDPEVLRWKVHVFVELAKTNALVKRQSEELRKLADTRAQLLQDLERKAAELAHAKALAEQESHFKTKFLRGMSHELRTPLNAIIGFSELLQAQIEGPLSPKQNEWVGLVLASGRHLLSLVNEVLDLAKVEAGRMELMLELVKPESLIANAVDVVRPQANKRGVKLELAVEGTLPSVLLDPFRTKQILYNLLSNGVKFTPSGGRVRLEVRSANGALEIVVADTGVGIRREDLPRLFREFERLEPTASAEGTGLGLALTHKLVTLHGGTISVDSEPGRGARFTVRLPIEGAKKPAPAPVVEPVP